MQYYHSYKEILKESVIYLKNMVCSCCIRVINEDLADIGVRVVEIRLGLVRVVYDEQLVSLKKIHETLEKNGFTPITNKEQIIVEQIKSAVIELVHFSNGNTALFRNSDYLIEKLEMSYQYISSIFSKHENITLERFIILHKIEKVKELLEYNELTLSEIAYALGYSSVQYLSTQFKSITSVSVSDYRKNPQTTRLALDKIAS